MVFITVQFLNCLAPLYFQDNPVGLLNTHWMNFEPLGVLPRMSDGGLVPWSARVEKQRVFLRYFVPTWIILKNVAPCNEINMPRNLFPL